MRSTIFRTTTPNPNGGPARPRLAPRGAKGEGEAARNNVVMSAGKRSCPYIICYLLSVHILSRLKYSLLPAVEFFIGRGSGFASAVGHCNGILYTALTLLVNSAVALR